MINEAARLERDVTVINTTNFRTRYCDKDAQYILECTLGFISTCFPNSFEIEDWNCYAGVCPQQAGTAAVDCGPLMLLCMEAVSRRAQIVLPDRLKLGSSLRIEIKNQVFDNRVAHLSEGATDLHRPSCFLWPARDQFSFLADLTVPPPRSFSVVDQVIDQAIDQVIDLTTPAYGEHVAAIADRVSGAAQLLHVQCRHPYGACSCKPGHPLADRTSARSAVFEEASGFCRAARHKSSEAS
ncbi:unnamed protein product [Bemisia tabaci]|uniref:Uncharacterized protein n=1 Tax=Bemisia tabaci TaxID=7038 RepID=A0A9P0A7T9_BEMTA|nr:unnamed protein product [Bemisia tabaci]